MDFEDVFDELGVLPKPEGQLPEKVSDEDLQEWAVLKAIAKEAAENEMRKRRELIAKYFPVKAEGSVTRKTPMGLSVAVTFTVNRSIDKGILTAFTPQLEEAKVSLDAIIKNKPELVVSAYRTLTDAQRTLFDQVMTIKEGTPQITVTVPASMKKGKK